jgi:hypothetical protein
VAGVSKKHKRKGVRKGPKTQQRQSMLVFRPLVSIDGPVRFGIRNEMGLEFRLQDQHGDVPCEAFTVIWAYKRNRSEKGSKVICQIPVVRQMCAQDPDDYMANCDWIFAIDTNTDTFLGKTISVSCVLGGRVTRLSEHDGKEREANFLPVLYFAFWDQPGKPETLAWKLLMSELANDPMARVDDRVAIVVDSELGSIELINQGTPCLTTDFALPQNYQLVYASADVGDFAFNKVIRQCDKQARDFFNGLKDQYSRDGFPRIPEGAPFLGTWEFPDGLRNRVLAK